MALLLNITDSTLGIAVPTAYVRITGLLFDANTGRFELYLAYFISPQARAQNKSPFQTKTLRGQIGFGPGQADLEAADSMKGLRAALYDWLKLQPEFETAVDVLDPAPPEPTLTGFAINGSVGTLTLSSMALRGGVEVALSSESETVQVPGTVIIPGTLTSFDFPVTIVPGAAEEEVDVQATHDEVTLAVTVTVPAAP